MELLQYGRDAGTPLSHQALKDDSTFMEVSRLLHCFKNINNLKRSLKILSRSLLMTSFP